MSGEEEPERRAENMMAVLLDEAEQDGTPAIKLIAKLVEQCCERGLVFPQNFHSMVREVLLAGARVDIRNQAHTIRSSNAAGMMLVHDYEPMDTGIFPDAQRDALPYENRIIPIVASPVHLVGLSTQQPLRRLEQLPEFRVTAEDGRVPDVPDVPDESDGQ